MIDGFGWFAEEDYRRTLLLFESITYVVPQFVDGVSPPPWLLLRDDLAVVTPEAERTSIAEAIDRARHDAAAPEFRELVLSTVPLRDREYANRIVALDREIRSASAVGSDTDGIFAISYLADKLLRYADGNGHLPVVGQDYATRIVAWKRERELVALLDPAALITKRQSSIFQAISAGLSFSYLANDDLRRTSVAQLLRFRDDNRDLLRRHHLHIAAVTQEFSGFPDDNTLAERIARLRLEAARMREEMDEEARSSWLSMGLELTEKGLLAGASGAVTALALLGSTSVSTLTAAAVPSLITGLAIAAGRGITTYTATRQARRVHASYLLNARRDLADGGS